MAVDPFEVATLLRSTLSLEESTRKMAEQMLKQRERCPGFGVILVQLAVSAETASEVQIASAVRLKNFVRENWNKEKCEVDICDEERKQLRNASLECMFSSTGAIRKQFSQVVCVMGKCDFPAEWPELIVVFAECLRGADMHKIEAALAAMDELFRRYRHAFKSNELWKEIRIVLDNAAAPLTDLFEKTVALIPQKDTMSSENAAAWLDVLLLIVKVFHSLSSQDLPDYFEDHLTTWMDGCLKLLKLNIRSLDDGDDSSSDVLYKLKSSVCEVITLYSQRFEEEVMPYMQSLIEVIWQLLVEMDSRARFDIVVNAALDFLSAICHRQQYAGMFEAEGVLRTICEDVIVKNAMLRQCDIEQFDEEPTEYLKRDIEGSDVGTRRRGASEFVRALCRRFAAPVVAILSDVLCRFLADCATSLDASWLKKDVIYCLVTAVAARSETTRFGATSTNELVNVVDFYESNVRSDLLETDVNRLPMLRADAFKYVVTFRNQLKAEHVVEAVGAAAGVLSSKYPTLHLYAAYAIERLLTVKKGSDQALISRSNLTVGPVIAALFHVFDVFPGAQNSHYVARALMRCFNIIDVETAKCSEEIVNKIAVMIGSAVKNPVDPRHLHFLFESLCILIRQTYSLVDGGIDSFIIPLIEQILDHDITEYVPYALQITALLLDQAHAQAVKSGVRTADRYLPFLNYLFSEHVWLVSANTPAAVLLVESFIRAHKELVLKERGAMLHTVMTKLISSKSRDTYGFSLASVLLGIAENSGAITESSLMTPMLHRLQYLKTKKFVRQFVVFLARFCILRGGLKLLQVFEGIQKGMFVMVIEKIVIEGLKEFYGITFEERRLLCVGFGKLLAETVVQLGDKYGPLVEAMVGLLEANAGSAASAARDEEVDAEDVFASGDVEYSDPFCKLTFAQHSDGLAADVENFKGYFAKAVMELAAGARPDVSSCVSEQTRAILVSYARS